MEKKVEDHVFKCPECPQMFKSTYDEIGLEMDCPQCDACFRIPDGSETKKLETSFEDDGLNKATKKKDKFKEKSGVPVFSGLNDEELKMLDTSPSEVLVENLKILTRQHCWEYFVVAALLINQLDNLKQTVLDTSYKQEAQKGWKKNRLIFNDFLKNYSESFFSTFNLLYKLVSDDLQRALEKEDLSVIFELAKKFDQQIIKLAEIHVRIYREPMPPEEPYLTLHQIITDWVPYCCRSLLDFVENLQEKSVNLRCSNRLRPQISLITPSYFQYMKIMNELGVGSQA